MFDLRLGHTDLGLVSVYHFHTRLLSLSLGQVRMSRIQACLP